MNSCGKNMKLSVRPTEGTPTRNANIMKTTTHSISIHPSGFGLLNPRRVPVVCAARPGQVDLNQPRQPKRTMKTQINKILTLKLALTALALNLSVLQSARAQNWVND